MKTIYRYKIPIIDRCIIGMPSGSRVLPAPPGVRNNDSEIEIWAQVDTTQPTVPREFVVIGTGNPMPDHLGAFVATVVTHSGALVWHVFEG